MIGDLFRPDLFYPLRRSAPPREPSREPFDFASVRCVEVRYLAGPHMAAIGGRKLIGDAFEAAEIMLADLAIAPEAVQGDEIECFGRKVALRLSDFGRRRGSGRVLAIVSEGLSLVDLNVGLFRALRTAQEADGAPGGGDAA